MANSKFNYPLSLIGLTLLSFLLSGCGKNDWTYEEVRDRFHGEYNGYYHSEAGNSREDFRMIEISDSISMIMGKSFDSTYIGVSHVDLETGIMKMYGSNLLHLTYLAGARHFTLVRYEPEEVYVSGWIKP